MATQKEYDKFEKEFKTVEHSLKDLIDNFGKIPNVGKLIADYYINISVWMQVVVDEAGSVEEIDEEELEKITQEIMFLRDIIIPKYKAVIAVNKEFKELIKSREV